MKQFKKIIYIASIATLFYFGVMFILNLTNSTNTMAYTFLLELFTIPSLLIILVALVYWVFNIIKNRNFTGLKAIALVNLASFLVIVLFYRFFN
ncbi:hypothetical protein FUA48_12370 [Flavobacterium alkalisoli]|uniref:Uncharacterized protein n=1 Tax=Flavobacterium alkalisoli TaxID=2602769 RepID=A0A5B9FSQ0_9FLAO|nr:hypothetical protein [Flavobacterium alkalisoli]QEE50343.1 hypothetical protein FUA48_12370 [Flavobacterium alkalisoli]